MSIVYVFFFFSTVSMVYHRTDDVVHRVVTCLGCGWCSFVLRAHDAAQPPASLASHMSHCAGKGGRLTPLNPLPANLLRPSHPQPTRALVNKLTAESTAAGDAFAARFPSVRGFASASSPADAAAAKRLTYQSPLRTALPAVSQQLPKIEPVVAPATSDGQHARASTPKKVKQEPAKKPHAQTLINGNVSTLLS